jgi:hypothetical protein
LEKEEFMDLPKATLKVLSVGCAFLLIALVPANAQTLDQESPYVNASFNADYSGFVWQQEVTVGMPGPLVQIELYVTTPGSCEVFINAGAPWQYDDHDFVTTLVADSTGWKTIDTSSANLSFNPDDHFVIGFHGLDTGMWLGGSYQPPEGGYERGRLWINEAIHDETDWDIAFRTYVPEPGTLALLSLGALAMVSRRR